MTSDPPRAWRGAILAIAFMSAITLPTGFTLAAQPSNLLQGFGQSRGIIETSRSICLMLELYLADTPQQHTQGLMYIRSLDEFEGMLFRYPKTARITMWMKNTYVPLDMIFIRADGTVAGITRNTEPHSLRRITSPEDLPGVLEVNAGFAERWDIRPGNRILSIN